MSDPRPIVIAHRGASGYLPEHTLAAKTLAYAMGADFLEQDLVATRDDQLIVMHDVHLDRTTDVASVFPDRARADGRWYARDFDLAELRELKVYERVDADGQAVYPERFPAGSGCFRLHSFEEELAFVARLNEQAERPVGIYPELKRPAWHREQGVDLAPLVLESLARFGYRTAASPVYVQCFDPAETERLRHEFGTQLRLVQLIGSNDWHEAPIDYEVLQSDAGLAHIAEFADAIGPWIPQLYTVTASGPQPSGLVERAHAAGLAVHPYTFRADELPPGFTDFTALVQYFAQQLAIDGLFTDFPDRARAALAIRL